jgi:hypothetical protein
LKLVLNGEEVWWHFHGLTIFGSTCWAQSRGYLEILPVMLSDWTHCIKL